MMGKVRVGYDRWALNADVVYMDLGASKNGLTVAMQQWMVEPTLSYTVCKGFEALAGARYNNPNAEIRGPLGRNPSGTQEWWDPIMGANLSLPLGKGFSFNVRGDIGASAWARTSPGRRSPTLAGSLPNGGRPKLATAGYSWITKPAAAPADSNTTCSTMAHNSDSRSIFGFIRQVCSLGRAG
jgi:hypothetical protein